MQLSNGHNLTLDVWAHLERDRFKQTDLRRAMDVVAREAELPGDPPSKGYLSDLITIRKRLETAARLGEDPPRIKTPSQSTLRFVALGLERLIELNPDNVSERFKLDATLDALFHEVKLVRRAPWASLGELVPSRAPNHVAREAGIEIEPHEFFKRQLAITGPPMSGKTSFLVELRDSLSAIGLFCIGPLDAATALEASDSSSEFWSELFKPSAIRGSAVASYLEVVAALESASASHGSCVLLIDNFNTVIEAGERWTADAAINMSRNILQATRNVTPGEPLARVGLVFAETANPRLFHAGTGYSPLSFSYIPGLDPRRLEPLGPRQVARLCAAYQLSDAPENIQVSQKAFGGHPLLTQWHLELMRDHDLSASAALKLALDSRDAPGAIATWHRRMTTLLTQAEVASAPWKIADRPARIALSAAVALGIVPAGTMLGVYAEWTGTYFEHAFSHVICGDKQ